MNLTEIRSFIGNVINESVTTPAYKTQLDEAINVAYNSVWLSEPWVFTVKTSQLKLYRDLVPSDTTEVIDIDIDSTNMSRRLVFSQILRPLGDDFYSSTYDGQIIEIEDVDYPILKSVLGETVTSIWLNEPWRSTDTNQLSSSTDWTIKHPYYRLPEDCVELLSWHHTDSPVGGALHAADIGPTISSDLCPVRTDDGSDYARIIYRAPDLQIPDAKKIRANVFNSTTDTHLPDGTYVELAWSFYYAGDYGALSESSGVMKLGQGAGAYNTIVVDCLDSNGELIATPTRNQPLDIPYPMRYEGLKKVLWYNTNLNQSATTGTNGTTLSDAYASIVRQGLPCWKMVSSFDPDETQLEYRPVIADDSDYNLELTHLGQLQSSERQGLIIGSVPIGIEKRYLPHKTQQVRPWPRITSSDIEYPFDEVTTGYDAPALGFKEVTIKYLCRPYPLCLPTDTPNMPSEFHYLIAYKTLEDWFVKMGQPNEAAYYRRKYDEEIVGLRRRYLNVRRLNTNRRSWLGQSTGNPLYNSGRVTWQ